MTKRQFKLIDEDGDYEILTIDRPVCGCAGDCHQALIEIEFDGDKEFSQKIDNHYLARVLEEVIDGELKVEEIKQ